MQENKRQDLIFTLMMCVTMVYIMSIYNISLQLGRFQYSIFIKAFHDLVPFLGFAFIIEYFMVKKIVIKLTFRLLDRNDKPILKRVVMAGFFTMLMSPIMSLFATLFYNGFTSDWLVLWLPSLVKNFPFALFIQIFYVGPLVNFVFKKVFNPQLQH